MSLFNKNITISRAKKPIKNPRFHRRSIVWIGLAILAIVLSGTIPEMVWESWYYRGLFPLFRVIYDFTLGWSPIPMVYILLVIILFRVYIWLIQMRNRLWFQMSRLLGGLSVLVLLFYALWGFNYGQTPFHQRLGIQKMSMSEAEMNIEFRRATNALLEEALALPVALHTENAIKALRVTDNDLRNEVKKTLSILELPSKGRVRVRQLKPDGLLMRWGTAGIYIPHTGEGHIDGGSLSVQKPYTLAHEMAHGYGVTDEGACNFIAWLACHQSEDPWIRFGGALSYWRFAASAMPDTIVIDAIESLPPIVSQCINLVRINNAKYPDIMPKMRNAIYSSYLKRHGVKSGLRSYHEVVVMVHHYLKTNSIH